MTKILLVEDDKSLREIYGVRLLAEGYDIVSAGDGEEALAMAIKERPGLIISDVMMPKISGFDMLDILRSTTETKNIRVIMMTALSSEEQRLRGEALGADKYLVKSQVGIEDVVRVVHEVLDDQPTSNSAANFNSTDFAVPPTYAPVQAPAPVVAPSAAPVPPQPVTEPQPYTTAAQSEPYPPQLIAPPSATSTPQYVTPPAFAQPFPQPTNAYETPRPAGAGERIIQPLPSAQNPTLTPDINALLDRELAAEAASTVSPAEPGFTPPTVATNEANLSLPPELQMQLAAQPVAPAAGPAPSYIETAPVVEAPVVPPQPPIQQTSIQSAAVDVSSITDDPTTTSQYPAGPTTPQA